MYIGLFVYVTRQSSASVSFKCPRLNSPINEMSTGNMLCDVFDLFFRVGKPADCVTGYNTVYSVKNESNVTE